MLRLLLSFLAVLLLMPAIVALTGALEASPDGARRLALVSAGAVAGLGLPAFLVCRCRGWWRAWQFLLGGTVLGLLAAPAAVPAGARNLGFLLVVLAIGGGLHALLFWWLAVWRNPRLTEQRVYCLPGGTVYRVCRVLRRPAQPDGREEHS